VQVDPLAQAVGPVHCIPPHWPHFGEVPPLPVLAEVVRVVVTTRVVTAGVVAARVVVVVTTPPRVVERVVGAGEAVVTARVVDTGGVTTPESGLITLCHANVELIGPHLMSEKATYAFGELASTSAGLPESREQVPRLTPGADGSAVTGN
jgi:hypothetical protein